MPARSRAFPSYRLKILLGLALVALADRLFLFHAPGATVGLFAIAWAAAAVASRPGLLREPRAAATWGAAVAFGLLMIDRPSLVGWFMFCLCLAVAALSARVADGEPVWRWGQRLVVLAVLAWFTPAQDALRLHERRPLRNSPWLARAVGLTTLPLLASAVFLALFASANPIIGQTMASLKAPSLDMEDAARLICWGVIFAMVGAVLRPRWRSGLIELPDGGRAIPGVNPGSVTLSLALFNLLFAIQNGLDLVFLWSGAPLPEGVTLAEYAHRGAYPLIVTALLAGLFVLVALRPGGAMAQRPTVRWLVMLWTAQNLVLVASSLLRTFDYVEAFALTRLRLAAMIWMVLVAAGLALICWRVVREKSAHWLINANAAALVLVLTGASIVDLGSVAAAWNVRHAREVDGAGAALDLCYLQALGPPALVSLAELEARTTDDGLRRRVASARAAVEAETLMRQARWRGWTWRDARRLNRMAAILGAGARTPAPDLDCRGEPAEAEGAAAAAAHPDPAQLTPGVED